MRPSLRRDPRARVHACPGARVQAGSDIGVQTGPRAARQGVRQVSLTPASVLHQKNINHLSIQLMGASSLDAVAQFVRANRLVGQVWIHQTRFHGSPWYVVLKGSMPA